MIERSQIVLEAKSWIGTPYHLGARLKGVGCDCYTFISEVMLNCKVVKEDDLPIYSGDWWAHISDEHYLRRLMRFATKAFEGRPCASQIVEPGSVLAVKAVGTDSKVFNHGAIVTQWPMAIHSVEDGVEEVNVTLHPMWAGQEIRIFDPLGDILYA